MKCRPYFHLPRPAASMPWSLPNLCAAYALPRNLPGTGKIAIIELGGSLSTGDIALFARSAGMPLPSVGNFTSPFPSDPQGANVECALDVQVAAFVYWWCTGRPAQIEMIWDQTGTIYDGVPSAAALGCSTCSISWGAPEDEWGAFADLMENAGWAAAASGMAVLAASGDNDFGDSESGAHVDLPAAARSVIGCSGTTKTAVGEVCWNNGGGEGTGGGFSVNRKRPKWQTGTPRGTPANWGRAVGDVSANADPNTGYQIVCGGQHIIVGGTSAAAPFWAGLLAAISDKPGFCTWQMYARRAACFTPVIQGNNGKWPATICNGLGTPTGATIGNLLS